MGVTFLFGDAISGGVDNIRAMGDPAIMQRGEKAFRRKVYEQVEKLLPSKGRKTMGLIRFLLESSGRQSPPQRALQAPLQRKGSWGKKEKNTSKKAPLGWEER